MADNLPTVVIADDHPSMRADLRRTFHGKIDVVGEADNASMMVAKSMVHKPDLVVTDYHMPGMGVIDASETIIDKTDARVLLFTGHLDESLVVRSMRVGISGITFKGRESSDEVCSVLLHAHRHSGTYYAPEWHDRQQAIEAGDAILYGAELLSERQIVIMQCRGCAKSFEVIQQELGISRGTIMSELAKARKYLGAKSNEQLMLIAAEQGLISHAMCSRK